MFFRLVFFMAVMLLTACVERTEETEKIRQENIANNNSEYYYETFVDVVPEAYWQVCELITRDGFEFDKIIGVSGLDLIDGGVVSGSRSVSLKRHGKIVLHIQQPTSQRNVCYINGWTNSIDRAPDMIDDAIAGINCSPFSEIEPMPNFHELGGRSFICGTNRLHAAINETEPNKVFVGISVERRE